MRFRHYVLLALMPVLLASSAAAASAGRESGVRAQFRVADGSAACRYDAGVLGCRTRASDSAFRLMRTGTVVAGDVPVFAWDRRTPVLRRSWKRGGISCTVARTIRCENRSGTQLVVGGKTVAVLAPPAISP